MMRSSGGDESIPKFATFDDGETSYVHSKNTTKTVPSLNSPYVATLSTSSGDVKSSGIHKAHEQSRTEAWSTIKGFIGKSASASNLVSRLTLNEDEEINHSSMPLARPVKTKDDNTPQDRQQIASALSHHRGKSSNKPKDSHRKTTTFANTVDLDRESIVLKQHYASKNCTFQNYSERMSVSVRVVDLSNRVAFSRPSMPTGSQIREYAYEMIRNKGLKVDNVDNIESVLARISPSPQYVDIFNTWKRVPSIRQLCWSPSVSREADPFYGWSDDDNDAIHTSQNEELDKKSAVQNRLQRRRHLILRRRRTQAKKDGRYFQIDTISYIKETLPNFCPYLSFRKRRLPMRTDVGFDGASEGEISIKEDEIRQESVLEEISPRIIVLLTSDFILACSDSHRNCDSSVHPDVLTCLTHRVSGIPFSGKELAIAKQRNLKTLDYYSRLTSGNSMPLNHGPKHIGTQGNPSEYSTVLRPNRYSVFAPPLDATISSSQLWKPRPFFDRPTGFIHLMAVPFDVKFDLGDIEPLVCTLALFSLPEKDGTKYFKGKISEDFIFSAGNWTGILSGGDDDPDKQVGFDTGQKNSSDINYTREESNLQPWRRRTNKALFSFNPLDLPTSKNDEFPSLFLVLQIYQLIRRDAAIPYLNDDSSRKMSAKGNRVIGALSGNRKRVATSGSFDDNKQMMDSGILSYLKMYGTQFLTPLCFGLTPVFPSSRIEYMPQWPNGASQSIQLFAYPACPESHGEFVNRLSLLSSHVKGHESITMGNIGSVSSYDTRSSSQVIEEHDEGFEFLDKSTRLVGNTTSVKKRSPLIPFTRAKTHSDVLFGNETVRGKAFVFTSLVDSDFSQVMLQHPTLFEQESLDSIPRLLVNITGDGAIMSQRANEGDIVKRSSLLRLPISGDASGYAGSSEIREVLYVPSYLDIADVSSALPQSSFIDTNLLYLYPQFMKIGISPKVDDIHRDILKGGHVTYVLEIGLSHQGSSILQSVYNPSPGGNPLVHSVYTKIPLPFGRENSIDIRRGIHLRDEVKIKLPDILDETYFLEFTVHVVHLNGDNENELLGVSKIADSSFPLCTSSSIKGNSVFTIIADGLHHLNVGNFQVTFSIRVASNIHNSNSSITAAANIFPSMQDVRSFAQGIPSFCEQWSRISSEVARIDYFYAWAYTFLSGCVALASGNDTTIQSASGIHFRYKDALHAIMNSLLSLVNIVKGKFINSNMNANKSKNVVKEFIDDFDDSSILHYLGDEVSAQLGLEANTKSMDLSPEEELDEKIHMERDESTNVKTRKSVRYSADQSIFDRKKSNSIKQTGAFRRNAYGTSKFDRMKAEAVINDSSHIFSQLMDDEETIFTTGTWQTGLRSTMNPHSAKYNVKDDSLQRTLENLAVEVSFSDKKALSQSPEPPTPHNADGTNVRKPISVVNQVNSVAQMLIIPCVFPAYSSGSPTSKTLRQSKSNVINGKVQKGTNRNDSVVRLIFDTSRSLFTKQSFHYLSGVTFYGRAHDLHT